MRPRIKICGITRLEDALSALSAGADALGFVFYPGSRRYVAPDVVARMVERLPPFVTLVGLFVNAGREAIRATVTQCRLDVIQLHGDESPDECRDLPVRVIKAVRVGTPGDLVGLERYPVQGWLLDAKVADHYGGSGCCFDWSWIGECRVDGPVILAGGLTPDNVGEAVRLVRPYAVDVSSGVERSPGIKDGDRMATFVRRVHEAAAPLY